jgi:hypothetical protein
MERIPVLAGTTLEPKLTIIFRITFLPPALKEKKTKTISPLLSYLIGVLFDFGLFRESHYVESLTKLVLKWRFSCLRPVPPLGLGCVSLSNAFIH